MLSEANIPIAIFELEPDGLDKQCTVRFKDELEALEVYVAFNEAVCNDSALKMSFITNSSKTD